MQGFLIWIIDLFVQIVTLLIIVHVLLSYFMSPYHPIRQAIDRLMEPLLFPIRRLLPRTGMIDFSPLILLLLVRLSGTILIRLLMAIGS